MRFLRLIQLELFGPFKEPTDLVQSGMLFTFDKIDMKRTSLSVLLSLIRELVSELNRPDHSSYNENFTFNQNYQARSVKSLLKSIHEGDGVFQQKLLQKSIFHCQNNWSAAMFRPVSSNFWKAPLVFQRMLD